MLRNNRRVAIACWLFAGLPILITFFQSIIAILGLDASTLPVLGNMKEVLDSVAVFDAAGEIFRDNDITVFALFILIALSWLGVGVGMFGVRDRQKTYAMAGLVTLFFILFVLVYAELFFADIPAVQRITFVAIPIATVLSLWVGVTSHEWSVALQDETSELLGDMRQDIKNAEGAFVQETEQQVDQKTLDWLSDVAPQAVRDYEESVEQFGQQCEGIRQEADDIAEDKVGSSSKAQYQQAKELRERARSLDPQSRAETIIETLRSTLSQELRSEFSDVTIKSRYGESYAIRNLDRYNQIESSEARVDAIQIGGDVHELGERLAAMIENGQSLHDVSRTLNQTNTHLDEMEGEIKRNESEFDEQLDAATKSLTDAREALSRIDQPARERIEEMLFEGRFGDEEPTFPTEPAVNTKIERAKSNLHDCRFRRAHETLSEAKRDAEEIKDIAIFFVDSVVPTIHHGTGSIPLPDSVDPALAQQLRPSIQQTYDVEYSVVDKTLHIEATEAETEQTEQETTTTAQDNRSSAESDHSTEDILYLLQELRGSASEGDSSNTATIQLGEYPDKFSDQGLLEAIESFCRRQNGVKEIQCPDADPGYITVVANEDTNVRRVLSNICEKYRDQKL